MKKRLFCSDLKYHFKAKLTLLLVLSSISILQATTYPNGSRVVISFSEIFNETLPNNQQQKTQGTIVDESGTPLLGASVIEKGTNQGTQSDFDGNFTLTISRIPTTLVVSYVGYTTQEIAVIDTSRLKIVMKKDISNLDEVVIVGYGTQKKEAITSSIVSIKSEKLNDITTTGVSSMLQGKAAGVQALASSGRPGATPSILIRGKASLGGRVTPLWVVDGVVQPDAPVINPSDVSGISILKDASATALYGSRGANGVIIVNTKRGKAGKPQITASLKTAVNQFNNGNFQVMNSSELYQYHELFGNSKPWFTKDLLSRNTDWLDLGTQLGLVKDANISFSSGTDKLGLFINGGYYTETGTIKDNELDRYTFRMNLDYQIMKKLKIMPKLSFSFDNRDHITEASLYNLYLYLPWDLPYDDKGVPVNANKSQDWIGRDKNNYLFDQQWNYSSNNTFNMSGNFDFEYQILPHLKFISSNNFTIRRFLSKSYTDPNSNAGLSDGGSIQDFTSNRLTRLTTQIVKYKNTFNDLHNLSILGGYEYNDYTYEDFSATGNGIISGGEILNVASKPGGVGGLKDEYALQSFFAAAEYGYANKLFGKVSARRDGASNFGPDNRYGNFFSIGGGWLIHNEAFFKSRWVNELKLRVSYGSVGNRPSSFYPYQDTYRVNTQYVGIPGAVINQLGNSDLGWEKSYETNIALDTQLFKRITASIEYYNKSTSDLLYFVSLPDVTAYSGYWENVGAIKNKGFEFSLAADIIKTDTFNWNLNFNIAANQNRVTELFEADQLPRGQKIWQVGEDADSWYMRKWAGVNSQNGEPQWEVVDPNTGAVTLTSDYSKATTQRLGSSSSPDFFGGFGTSIDYKNVSLSANFDYSKGGYLYNASRELFDSDGFYSTFNQQVLRDGWSRWEQPGDIATHPQAIEGGNNNSNKPSSRYLEDGSYLRMRNVTLSYTLPRKLLRNIGLSQFRIYCSGDNLFTLTKFSGPDPTSSTDPNAREADRVSGRVSFNYPIPKRYAIGINVTF